MMTWNAIRRCGAAVALGFVSQGSTAGAAVLFADNFDRANSRNIDGSLVGIKAVVMNGATIGRECLIGANALVAEGKSIPDRSLVLGSPGKVVRTLTDEDVARLRHAAEVYVAKGAQYRRGLAADPRDPNA